MLHPPLTLTSFLPRNWKFIKRESKSVGKFPREYPAEEFSRCSATYLNGYPEGEREGE